MNISLFHVVDLLVTVHDEAGVNGAAIDLIKNSGDRTVDAMCGSHTLNNSGELFKAKYVDEMLKVWNAFVSHSPATWVAYWISVGSPCPRLSSLIRWWVKWEEIRDPLL